MVTSLVSKEEFFSMQSGRFVEDTFAGSLPKFLTAFTRRKKLSEKEIAQLQQYQVWVAREEILTGRNELIKIIIFLLV